MSEIVFDWRDHIQNAIACNKKYDGGYDMKKILEFILDELKKYERLYNNELNGEGNVQH